MGTDEKQICSLALKRLLQVRVLLGDCSCGTRVSLADTSPHVWVPSGVQKWVSWEMGRNSASREVGCRDQWHKEHRSSGSLTGVCFVPGTDSTLARRTPASTSVGRARCFSELAKWLTWRICGTGG